MSQSGLSLPRSWVFLESDFVLLGYESLHSEVARTEENDGKSEFTLFASWLITLHIYIKYFDVKTPQKSLSIASKARAVFPPRVRSFRMGKGVSCLAFTWSKSHDHTTDQSYFLQNTISLFYSSLWLNATCDSRHWQMYKNPGEIAAHKKRLIQSRVVVSKKYFLVVGYCV